MKTILITGVAGLIGSRLAHHLLDNYDVQVIGVDDFSGGFKINLPAHDNFHFYGLNIASDDPFSDYNLQNIFESHKPDIVYHMAAYAAECVSPFIRNYNYMNNLIASANVINACINADVKRLVFTSSMAVYGAQTPPFHEDLPYAPIDPYGVAKAAVEQDIKIAGEQHGLDWCIIRPHNVYGRAQNIFDPYRNFIGIAMYKVLRNDSVTIYGDGLQTRAFSYIDDSLEPLWQAGVNPRASKQIINLGGIEQTTILDAAKTVIEVAGKGELIFLPPRHEVKHAYATWEKSIDILGFEHKTSLHDGIADMWEWAKSLPMYDRQIWNKYEVEKGLYPQWKPEALKDHYWKDKVNG